MSIELSFAKILKSMRLMRKMSQEELAFRSHLDRTYISMLERGINQPTLTTMFALSKALNIKTSEMIKLIEIDFEEVEQ